MSDTKTINIPDIGDFENVEVIEVLVQAGDTVAAEDAIISLESEKATIEVPTPEAGEIVKILVSEGDLVSEGTPMMEIKASGSDSEAATQTPEEPAKEPEVQQQDEAPAKP